MAMCRTCGDFPTDREKLAQSLQKYYDIYYNLTSIKLSPDEDPDRQRICDDCHLKLLEYNRFRAVCLQVHYKLTVIKTEREVEHSESTPEECAPVVEMLKVECLDAADEASNATNEFEVELTDSAAKQESDHQQLSQASGASDSECDKLSKPKAKRRKKKSKKQTEVCDIKEQLIDCTLCKKKFRTEARLAGHMRTHQGLKPALCTYCGKDFQKYISLKFHIQQKHSEKQLKYPCDYPGCEQVYSTKQGMTNHKKRHDPNFIMPEPKHSVCDQCGKTFSTSGALKKHSYIHTGDMPFECTLCKKRLPTAHKLKEHTMRHEGIKNHVCPYCGQKKTTRHELKVHMNYHTREKQFTCHVCAQVFSNIGNMSRHIKIVHCGIKAFNCKFCDRSFGKAETLKHHVMTHTGEKPHECTVCGKRFIQQVALQTHMKTHRKQERSHTTMAHTAHTSQQQLLQAAIQPMAHMSHTQQQSSHHSAADASPVCLGGFIN
ncbi:zinc finger protein 501-like [Topomyia yanbarensis]|uniref:zinc finger protein 501-like n=1 Tax=Topomyia yanbarensis TaxID=2498891 RepID=UPI00273BAA0D|nr:zinc finger protein 501-like [Topomyia yanbarensis]